MNYQVYAIIAFIIALGVSLFFVADFKHISTDLGSDLRTMTTERDALLETVATLTTSLAAASNTIAAMQAELSLTAEELEDLADDYREEKQRNDDFEDEYRQALNTVKDLDKLSKTDEELLQKYSKVYFLNEHYVPESIEEIDDEWKYNEDRSHQLHSKVIPFFENMLEAAKDDGIDIWVVSAYRSFDTQAQLKGAYTVTYGAGANTFSADQGFSEHQLGTTVDFTTTGLGGGLDEFENTPAYEWLVDNAAKYGFTMSYPEDNQYYIFEPWHWRFVGTELARDLDRKNETFYHLEQREINSYLLNIFD